MLIVPKDHRVAFQIPMDKGLNLNIISHKHQINSYNNKIYHYNIVHNNKEVTQIYSSY